MVTETTLKLVGDFCLFFAATIPLAAQVIGTKFVDKPIPGRSEEYIDKYDGLHGGVLIMDVLFAAAGLFIKILIYVQGP
ncbi:hypothetical protein [Haladaptatus sp. R4]|uniref:hypothetical protein n=1 Tax=Haladaptatus sp. R4 TaxID=1679489 RepID=UPI000A4150A4|nr:hypothetical protein [Haladaptatus sp. R4]